MGCGAHGQGMEAHPLRLRPARLDAARRGSPAVWLRGSTRLPRPSALLIKGTGRRAQACASSTPGRPPPHRPAPLPREFVKQISLNCTSPGVWWRKKPGNSPPLGHPFPASPAALVRSSRVSPRLCGTPAPAGSSCRVSSGHSCLHSTSSEPGHPQPISSSLRGWTLSPDAVTPGTSTASVCRLLDVSPPWKRPL